MFVVVKKKQLIIVAVAILCFLGLSIGLAVFGASETYFNQNMRKLPVYGVSTESEQKVIALTFDAAWGADKTQGILDILNEYEADATFFLVGFWVEKYPEMVKVIDDCGMEIGNHSNNHLHMSGLSEADILDEIVTVNNMIKDLTGKPPTHFRAPFGEYNDKLISLVEKNSMIGVQWSIDSLDWKGLSASEITKRIVPKAKSGDIVLFHNNSDHILEALPMVLMGLKAKGFKFVALGDLVLKENYTIDINGIQKMSIGG